MPTLDDAIEKIRTGNKLEGRQILEDLLDADENNEEIWLWMSTVVENDDDREICLENALALDPENVAAQQGVEALKAGIFSADDLLRDLLEEERAEVETPPPATFLDDFVITDDDFADDDDLPFPGEVKKPKRGGLNIKFVVIAVLVLVLLLVLAGLGAASWMLMSGGGSDGSNGQATPPASQESPAQQPAATNTPTPAATATPADTPTPKLQLPTAKPTDEPTPTATTVVSPTPIK